MSLDLVPFDLNKSKDVLKEQARILLRLPSRLHEYGFFVVNPDEDVIVVLSCSFKNNVLPDEYIKNYFGKEIDIFSTSDGNLCVLAERFTETSCNRRNGKRVSFAGTTFFGKAIIIGKKSFSGFRSLNLSSIINVILELKVSENYVGIEIVMATLSAILDEIDGK